MMDDEIFIFFIIANLYLLAIILPIFQQYFLRIIELQGYTEIGLFYRHHLLHR